VEHFSQKPFRFFIGPFCKKIACQGDQERNRKRFYRRRQTLRQERSMPRRPAKVTQADIARAIRAAKDAGASEVTVDCDGVIRIALTSVVRPVVPGTTVHEAWMPSEALQRYLKGTESG
jgi:hypothetical protein